MPRYDGSGPMGYGPMTGRGLGYCHLPGPGVRRGRVPRFSRRIRGGFGNGFGRGGYGYSRAYGPGYDYGYRAFVEEPISAKSKKDWLLEEKELLKQELKYINEQLEKVNEEADG